MAGKPELNGAPGGEEATGGTSGKKPGSQSQRHQETHERQSTPSRFMAAVGGVIERTSMFKRVESLRRSLGMVKKERPQKSQPLTPAFKEEVTKVTESAEVTERVKVTEVTKVTERTDVSESYTLTLGPPTPPSAAVSSAEKPSTLKRVDWVRRSLGMGKKERLPRRSTPIPDTEVTRNSKEVTKVTERAGVSESYTLPPGPSTLPSVLEVNSLIDSGDLLVALVNLLCLRQELQGLPSDKRKGREKDLHLLYSALRAKMADIVRQSSVLPARNKELLVQVARVVQEEERREGEAGGLGGWREAWRGAVRDGVRDVLKGVHLDTPEHNPSWLAVHLGLLGKAIVENLERVKAELKCSYPPSFRVFDEYVMAWHSAVKDHLTHLTASLTETKDCYALLHFIYKQYSSERILGNEVLLPEMREELKDLCVDENLLEQLRDKYCRQLQVYVAGCLQRIFQMEEEESCDYSDEAFVRLTVDITQVLKGVDDNVEAVIPSLQREIKRMCLSELHSFLHRLTALEKKRTRVGRGVGQKAFLHLFRMVNTYTELRLLAERLASEAQTDAAAAVGLLEELQTQATQQLLDTVTHNTEVCLRRYFRGESTHLQQLLNEMKSFFKNLPKQCHTHKVVMDKVYSQIVSLYLQQLLLSNRALLEKRWGEVGGAIRENAEEFQELFYQQNANVEKKNLLMFKVAEILSNNDVDALKITCLELLTDCPDVSKSQVKKLLCWKGGLSRRELKAVLEMSGTK